MPDISHLRTFRCLPFACIHGDLQKTLDNHDFKYVLLGYSAETSTHYRAMDISPGRVIMAHHIKYDQFILYHQLLRYQPTEFMLEPARELPSREPAPLDPLQQLLKAKVRPFNPINDSDDGLSPPSDSLEQ